MACLCFICRAVQHPIRSTNFRVRPSSSVSNSVSTILPMTALKSRPSHLSKLINLNQALPYDLLQGEPPQPLSCKVTSAVTTEAQDHPSEIDQPRVAAPRSCGTTCASTSICPAMLGSFRGEYPSLLDETKEGTAQAVTPSRNLVAGGRYRHGRRASTWWRRDVFSRPPSLVLFG